TDKITTIEKYNRLRKPLQKWAISITLLLLVFIMLTTLTTGIVKEISVIGLYIMIVLFVPSIMTFIAAFTRQLKSTRRGELDRKSTRLNSSHVSISYAVFCLKKKT